MARMTSSLVGVLAVVVGMAASCTGNGESEDDMAGADRYLLPMEDVPGATSAESVTDFTRSEVCGHLVNAERDISPHGSRSGEAAAREYVVPSSDGDVTVVVAVAAELQRIGFNLIMDGVEKGLAECPGDGTQALVDVESMTPLDDLPDGALGYSAQYVDDAGTPHVMERAYAAVDHRNVVMVGAEREGRGETGVDIRTLLESAVDNVEREIATD
jgi:hypothetical protein